MLLSLLAAAFVPFLLISCKKPAESPAPAETTEAPAAEAPNDGTATPDEPTPAVQPATPEPPKPPKPVIRRERPPGPPAPMVLFDFENPEFQGDWSAQGDLQAALVNTASLNASGNEAVSGRAVQFTGKANALLFCKPGKVPADWGSYGLLRFHVHRPADQAGKTVKLRVMVMDDDGVGQMFRDQEIESAGTWQQVDIPLRHFGQGAGRLIRWEQIRRLAFVPMEDMTIAIDSISLEPGPKGETARLSEEDLSQLAFGKPAEQTLIHNDGFLFMTDVAGVDFDPLYAEMLETIRLVESWLPLQDAPLDPPALLIFADEEQYRSFAPRYGELIKRIAERAKSDGYCIGGIATGFWDPKQGIRRPTFLHEFVHSVLEKRLLLPNRSEWFQESVANRLQIIMRPQAGLDEKLVQAISHPAAHRPLKDLCNGGHVPISHYWQCFTLFDMIISDPSLRPRIPALIQAFHKSGSTNLEPHIVSVLGIPFLELDARWRFFTLGRYSKRS